MYTKTPSDNKATLETTTSDTQGHATSRAGNSVWPSVRLMTARAMMSRARMPSRRPASRSRSGGSVVPRRPPEVPGPLRGVRSAWMSLDGLRGALPPPARSRMAGMRLCVYANPLQDAVKSNPRASHRRMDTDVLVVGAGPTGLMLANQLARRGVRPLIIDRHPGPSVQTRALGVQARTLEIYAHLGIVERALDLGKRATGANIWVQGRRAARIPLGDIGRDLSPYPFLLILGQDDNERLLSDALRIQRGAVQWNT